MNQALSQVTAEEIEQFLKEESLIVNLDEQVVTLERADVLVQKTAVQEGFSEASTGNFTVIVDVHVSEELRREGVARDFIRGEQDLRKKIDLPVDKRVELYVSCSKELQELIEEHKSLIDRSLILSGLYFSMIAQMERITLGEEEVYIGVG